MHRSLARVLFSFLVLSAVCGAAVAAGTPSLLSSTINVSASTEKDGASGALVVVVDGLKAPSFPGGTQEGSLTKPRDINEAAEKPPIVEFYPAKVLPLPASGTQRRWILPFTVFSMPAGKNLTRYVYFKVDDVEWALTYQLVSPAAMATTWSLKPVSASARSLMKGDKGVGLPIIVSVTGNLPVTGLSVSADPVEKDSKRSLSSDGWKLCKEQVTDKCTDPAPLIGAGMHKLWVMPSRAGDFEVGKYDAVITVASTEKPAGETVTLPVNVSSYPAQGAGLVAIAAGCILATYFTVFLRARVQRDEMLESVVRLREERDRVLADLNSADPRAAATNLRARLTSVDADLDDQKLEKLGLPKRFPSPLSKSIDASKLEQFRQYVEVRAAWLDACEVVVRDGVVALFNVWKGAASQVAARQPDLDTAIRSVDVLVNQATPPVPSSLAPLLTAEVTKLEGVLGVSPLGAGGGQPRTLQQLRLSVSQTTFVAWAIVLFVTVLFGVYSLILLNPGFGTCIDLVACFLWGMGLPTGAALAGATTSTVATTLNIVRS